MEECGIAFKVLDAISKRLLRKQQFICHPAAVRAFTRDSARFPCANTGKISRITGSILFKQQEACYNKSIKSD